MYDVREILVTNYKPKLKLLHVCALFFKSSFEAEILPSQVGNMSAIESSI